MEKTGEKNNIKKKKPHRREEPEIVTPNRTRFSRRALLDETNR